MDNKSSKKLGHDDTSGFNFVKTVLGDNNTAAVNFDRLQNHPTKGYIIFELLKCEESQRVTPYTSHPNRYWNKNKNKFLALWRAKQDFNATLYLVNYAQQGTAHCNEVLVIEVLDMDESGITKETVTKYTFDSFSKWFVKLNNECLTSTEDLIDDIYSKKTVAELGSIEIKIGKYKGKSLDSIISEDINYLKWFSEQSLPYSIAAKWYLAKRK